MNYQFLGTIGVVFSCIFVVIIVVILLLDAFSKSCINEIIIKIATICFISIIAFWVVVGSICWLDNICGWGLLR